MNMAYSRLHNNPYSQMYNLGKRNHPNFSWSQNHHDHSRSNFSNNFQPPNYQQNFLNQVSHSSFKNTPAEKKLIDLEKSMETLIKSQEFFMKNTRQLLSKHTQAISRLEVQMSQLASSLSKRPKGTLPNQSVINPRNSSQAHLVKD